MSWFYYLGRLLARTLLALLTRLHIKGRENIPREGPLLVVANHIATADPPLLAICINRKAIFMAKEELFRSRFVGYFIRSFGSFPVRRNRLDTGAIRQANSVLNKGWALIMFPEGRRSTDCRLQPALPGSALIAMHHGVPILPVGITGTEQIKNVFSLLRRPRIEVNIGPCFQLPPTENGSKKDDLTAHSALITGRIAEQLPQRYRRAEYAD